MYIHVHNYSGFKSQLFDFVFVSCCVVLLCISESPSFNAVAVVLCEYAYTGTGIYIYMCVLFLQNVCRIPFVFCLSLWHGTATDSRSLPVM